MKIRGACPRDYEVIQKLYTQYDFSLDIPHIESIFVIEDENKIVFAVGSLVRLLEGAFLVDKTVRKRYRIKALKLLLEQADIECEVLGFESYHSFATNDSILQILIRKFNFIKSVGNSLIKWVEKET